MTRSAISFESALSSFRNTFVPHSATKTIIENVRALYECGTGPSGASCGLVSGFPGVGKTRTISHFLTDVAGIDAPAANQNFERSTDPIHDPLPALLIEMPSPATPKSLLELLCAKLGRPSTKRMTAGALEAILEKLLHARQTRMIVIDEFQHLTSGKSKETRAHICDLMKSILNFGCTSMVFVGLPEIEEVVSADEQLNRRCAFYLPLGHFLPEEAHVLEFQECLARLNERMPIPAEFELDDPDAVERLYDACGGHLGQLLKLLIHALRRAHLDKSPVVSRELLAEVFAQSNPSTVTIDNPFLG